MKQEALPRTEAWVKEILSLPIFPGMADTDVDRVVASVKAYFAAKA